MFLRNGKFAPGLSAIIVTFTTCVLWSPLALVVYACLPHTS